MKDWNLILKTVVIILCILALIQVSGTTPTKNDICANANNCLPFIPLVRTSLPDINGTTPYAKREEKFRYYLQCSVRIHVNSSAGSGTICYYDDITNEAWVISCGHLFTGSKEPTNHNGTRKARIDVFYKNDLKLPTPQSFDAEVICYNRTEDISILRFNPDWEPLHYFPIASVDYPIHKGEKFESTGCDHAEEVSAYTVEVVEGMKEGQNLVTKNNSPRPGRSGGGLLSHDGYYLAVVWGTSALDGSGYGFYVPLRRIHEYLGQYEEVKWLLSVTPHWNIMNMIPLVWPDGQIDQLPPGFLPNP